MSDEFIEENTEQPVIKIRVNKLLYKKGTPLPVIDFSIFDRSDLSVLKTEKNLFSTQQGIQEQVQKHMEKFPEATECNIYYYTLES